MSEQRFSSLTAEDAERLDTQRARITQYLRDEDRSKYATAAGKLGLIRALLEAGVFAADDTWELQCLGIVLGDAFVQDLGVEWVMVEDEHGRDPALALPGTSVHLFPLTMISKRIERGEVVDVFQLFNAVAADVDRFRASGEYPHAND